MRYETSSLEQGRKMLNELGELGSDAGYILFVEIASGLPGFRHRRIADRCGAELISLVNWLLPFEGWAAWIARVLPMRQAILVAPTAESAVRLFDEPDYMMTIMRFSLVPAAFDEEWRSAARQYWRGYAFRNWAEGRREVVDLMLDTEDMGHSVTIGEEVPRIVKDRALRIAAEPDVQREIAEAE